MIEVDNGIKLLAGTEGKMLKSFKVGQSLSGITRTEMIASFEGGFELFNPKNWKNKKGCIFMYSLFILTIL